MADATILPFASARKTRVALLFGGRSGEHPISCVTAAGVMGAINREKYDVIPIGITRDGDWVVVDDADHADLTTGELPEVTLDSGRPIRTLADAGAIDVVFPVLHGPFGEDGTVQGLLEMADMRYVGCGVLASAVGMDKQFMKIAFAAAGLPLGPYEVVLPHEWPTDREAVLARVQQMPYPLFVKPARAGSSLGVNRVDRVEELIGAISEARRHDPKVIVEQGVDGREIECAVLGGRAGARARASVPGEIVVDHDEAEFYDFEAKYLSDSQARTDAPADLPHTVADQIRDVAVRAFEAIGGEGLARVDSFVTADGEVIINEINTLPGFTPISMYPKMWEATGLAYPDLIDELIQLALERPTGLR